MHKYMYVFIYALSKKVALSIASKLLAVAFSGVCWGVRGKGKILM